MRAESEGRKMQGMERRDLNIQGQSLISLTSVYIQINFTKVMAVNSDLKLLPSQPSSQSLVALTGCTNPQVAQVSTKIYKQHFKSQTNGRVLNIPHLSHLWESLTPDNVATPVILNSTSFSQWTIAETSSIAAAASFSEACYHLIQQVSML